MYGYRYTPTSRVFELPGWSLAESTAKVWERQANQLSHSDGNTPATVELVELSGTGEWVPVPIAPRPPSKWRERRDQQRRALQPATGPGPDALGVIPAKPRTGHRRRR